MFDFTLPTPKDADSALRQASRYDRAKALLIEGYDFSFDAELATIYVTKPGQLAAEYEIHFTEDLNGRTGCTCPDMARTGEPCKHYIAAMILHNKQREEAQLVGMEAEYALLANGEGPNGCEPLSY